MKYADVLYAKWSSNLIITPMIMVDVTRPNSFAGIC